MAEPFLSEIRLFSFGFPPKGWALANGQLLPINQNQALFSILGTVFGGDGRVNFALPDYRGRVPMHTSENYPVGIRAGESDHTLSAYELPSHTHLMSVLDTGSSDNNTNNPNNGLFSNSKPADLYQNTSTNLKELSQKTIGGGGLNQSHSNMQPYLTISFCIALDGIFPNQY
ncbi:MAG: tail fiber protein [Dyadobacter sp.]